MYWNRTCKVNGVTSKTCIWLQSKLGTFIKNKTHQNSKIVKILVVRLNRQYCLNQNAFKGSYSCQNFIPLQKFSCTFHFIFYLKNKNIYLLCFTKLYEGHLLFPHINCLSISHSKIIYCEKVLWSNIIS